MLKCSYDIPQLPLPFAASLETKAVLKAATAAYRAVAAVRSVAARVPNDGILIDTLSLQEAQASSEVENIITTQDELFQIGPSSTDALGPAQKEVADYRDSLWQGHRNLLSSGGLITNNTMISIYQTLKRTTGSYRATPGTTLTNDATREVVYVPPQSRQEIERHMGNLEQYINDRSVCDLDPLVKMAIIHHQFEIIHPFPDGNGRVGRILNVLYLVQQEVIDIPILYLSRYVTQTKASYYRLLQAVRDVGDWESWIIYMILGVEATARETAWLLSELNALLIEYKNTLRNGHSKIYSQELLNNLFRHPYTRIEYLMAETGSGRQAAARHLDELCVAGLLSKHRKGKHNYYINVRLVDLFLKRPPSMLPLPVFEKT
jgi:Fic family protein